MQEQLLTFYGLADCHGLESFIATEVFDLEKEEFFTPTDQTGMIAMRAQFNAQRFPVVYKVNMKLEDSMEIEELLEDGEYIEALEVLKEKAVNISLARVPGTNPKKNWDMIPNPILDPHS